MKRKILFILVNSVFAIVMLIPFSASSQCELYELDLENNQLNTATYDASCAFNVTPSHWEVRNSVCSLSTSGIVIPGDPAVTYITPVTVRVNRTGSTEADDSVRVQYRVLPGDWVDQLFFYGDNWAGMPDATATVVPVNINVSSPGDATIFVRVIFGNNAGATEKLFLKDGDICIGSSMFVMPIELISFNATVENNRIKLFWSTASEKNNKFFTVERSQNGASYQKVAEVDGAGNSTAKRNYIAYDNNPIFGSSYYRLKQTDFTGEIDYSDVVSVSVNFSSSSCKFRVVPNPCVPQCSVNMQGCEEQNISVALVDAFGNQVYSDIPISEGDKSFTIDPRNNLSPGVYILVGKGKKDKPNQRIVVQ